MDCKIRVMTCSAGAFAVLRDIGVNAVKVSYGLWRVTKILGRIFSDFRLLKHAVWEGSAHRPRRFSPSRRAMQDKQDRSILVDLSWLH